MAKTELKPAVEERLVIDRARVVALSRDKNEPLRIAALRQRGLDAYQRFPLPDRVRHLWRYSDPRDFMPTTVTEQGPVPFGAELPALPEGGVAVLLGGSGKPAVAISDRAAELAVEVLPLEDAVFALNRLAELVPAEHGIFEAMNVALWGEGIALRIPAGVKLAGPVHIRVAPNLTSYFPRLLLIVEELAEVTLLEEQVGGKPGQRTVGVTELFVADGARVRHQVIQRWGDGVACHWTHRAALERDAELVTVLSSFGGSAAKEDFGVALRGEGARSEAFGIALGEGRQTFDHHTVHHHLVGRTWSNLDVKVAVNQKAHSAYTGLIRIEPGAEYSEAFQENRNLLLSGNARAESIPELEILTNEVRCSHGSTSAPVDDEQLFFLRSRGISETEALRLIVRGFFDGAISRIPEPLRSDVAASLEARLLNLKGGA